MKNKCVAETQKEKGCKNLAYKDGKLCYLHSMILLREFLGTTQIKIDMLRHNRDHLIDRINELGMVYHEENNRPDAVQKDIDNMQSDIEEYEKQIEELKNDSL